MNKLITMIFILSTGACSKVKFNNISKADRPIELNLEGDDFYGTKAKANACLKEMDFSDPIDRQWIELIKKNSELSDKEREEMLKAFKSRSSEEVSEGNKKQKS